MTRAVKRAARFVLRRQEAFGIVMGRKVKRTPRQWWVEIVSPNGLILASTETYKRKRDALHVCKLINPALEVEER